MTRVIIASLPSPCKSFIKRLLMLAYERDRVQASTVARLVRDWELGAE